MTLEAYTAQIIGECDSQAAGYPSTVALPAKTEVHVLFACHGTETQFTSAHHRDKQRGKISSDH